MKNLKSSNVYIQHIDSSIYTIGEWLYSGFSDDEANGVALITDSYSCVISKKYGMYNIYISSKQYFGNANVMITTDEEVAVTDMAGYANTQHLLSDNTSGAIYSCATYTFPNGSKGYLPALGELKAVWQELDSINMAMEIIGGVKIDYSVPHWSSTLYSFKEAWLIDKSGTRIGDYLTSWYARPFTTLNPVTV